MKEDKKKISLSTAILLALNFAIVVAIFQNNYLKNRYEGNNNNSQKTTKDMPSKLSEEDAELISQVIPQNGIELNIKWGDIGKKLVEIGVIDKEKFLKLYKRGPISGIDESYEKILNGSYDGNIVITQDNSRFVLNTLWAFGLAQKSDVLDEMKAEYPQIENLAATGGWTIGKENAMTYYNLHELIKLNSEQENRIKEITSSIYRPCCNNSTAFADCNHGMAMLGLVELMVANGYSDEEIYKTALDLNAIWFPDTYLTIAKYMKNERNTSWSDIDAKEVLSAEYSSASGFRTILAKVEPVQNSGGGGSCGV